MDELDDYRWLVSARGREAIRRAEELAAQFDVVVANSRLRKDFTAGQVSLALLQAALRMRGLYKFSHAERMFFTDVGLQQASSERLAEYKAARFPDGETVHDLCSGIGGDLFALARRGPAIGVERDPVTALLAAANCDALELPLARIEQRDVADLSAADLSLVHIDPDRRPRGRRTTRVELHEPGEAFLESLIENCEGGAIKLAPATNVPDPWKPTVERDWISHAGECKQLVAWFGTLARRPGARVATALAADGEPNSIIGESKTARPPAIASELGRFVFEPDPAVIAAGLTETLAEREGLSLVGGAGYLTGDAAASSPLLGAFEVLDHCPMDLKRVKAMVKRHGAGTLEIKKRGVDVRPEQLRSKLKTTGDLPAVLIVTPLAGRVVAVLARRR